MENVEITQQVINRLVADGLISGVGYGVTACLIGWGIRKLFGLARSAWG